LTQPPGIPALLRGFLSVLAAAPGAAGAPVINEFLADPPGSDGGKEFVEIHNAGPALSLDGVTLEFANGAVEPAWEVRWTAPPGTVLAEGGFFLVCDRNWTGPAVPDAEVALGLQNGPDAIRLARDGTVLDLVGYGPLTDDRLFEGAPSPLQAGLALARRPDGADSDDNAADFVAAEATPGAPNFRDWDFHVVAATGDPPCLDRVGRSLRLEVQLENRGILAWPGGQVRLDFAGRVVPAVLDAVGSGGTRNLYFVVEPGRSGRHPVGLLLPLPGGMDTLRVPVCLYQVGLGDLVINEVQPAPDQGQGEYIELASRSEEALDLGAFALKDEDGDWRSLPAGSLQPGGLVVVAQDSTALAGWILANDRIGGDGCGSHSALTRLVSLAGWPSLNNAVPGSRTFADRISLADSGGVVVDALTYGGPDPWDPPIPGSGSSLERLNLGLPLDSGASTWSVSAAWEGGTPGCPNSVSPAESGGPFLTVQPLVLDADRGVSALALVLEVPAEGEGFQLAVFDLEGRRVRDLGGDLAGPGLRTRHWKGENDRSRLVPPGGYIVLGTCLDGSGAILDASRVLVVVR